MLGLPESVVMAIKKGDAATAAIFAVDSYVFFIDLFHVLSLFLILSSSFRL